MSDFKRVAVVMGPSSSSSLSNQKIKDDKDTGSGNNLNHSGNGNCNGAVSINGIRSNISCNTDSSTMTAETGIAARSLEKRMATL